MTAPSTSTAATVASDAPVTSTVPAPVPATAPAPLTAEQIAAQQAIAAREALINSVVNNALANKDAIVQAEALAIDATSTKGFNESLATAKLYNLPLAFLRNWRPARSNSKDKCPEELAVRNLHNSLRPLDGPARVSEVKDVIAAAVSSVPDAATANTRATTQDVGNPSVSATDKKAAWKTVAEARAAFEEALIKFNDQGERDNWTKAMAAADQGDYAPINALLRDAGNFVSKAKTTSRRWRAALILPHVDACIRRSGDIGAKWQPCSEKALKALHDLVSKRAEDKLPAPSEEECLDAMQNAALDYLGLGNGGKAVTKEEVEAKRIANAIAVIFNKLAYLYDNGALLDAGRKAIENKCREHGLIPAAKGNGKDDDSDGDTEAQAIAAQENAAAKVEAPSPAPTTPTTTSEDATAAAEVVSASDAPVTSDPAPEAPQDLIAKARAQLQSGTPAVAPKPKGATKASKIAKARK